ncbi:hypothetical protein M9Y10_027874 [Tritrichomonas musculus]|uniref:LRAT domain-containing protein n=1 Tax=Tritrichomonas musculus TaxID=1915356 RepID=A0ABR2H624_9EUKA
MTKIYSNAPKNGLRCCIGSEVMNRKLIECAAVLRPLDVPSTFWKYGKILSHSAVLCKTKKEHVLVEYSSTNMVHINAIGGFQDKESEIGPYFEYRGFIFHYVSPMQKPNKSITIRDFALKMASYACKKQYDVFTNNCHQARYLTMKHYGMKSHDPYNIKVNILFQGFADYFSEYNTVRVKKNIDFVKESYSKSTSNFFNEDLSKSSMNNISKNNNKNNNKAVVVRCSSTQDISKLCKNEDKSKEQIFSHNIHLDDENSESSSIAFLCKLGKYSGNNSSTLANKRRNSSVHQKQQHIELAKKVTHLKRCNSDTHIPKIKNPYRQIAKKQSDSSSNSLESLYLKSTSDSSSSQYEKLPKKNMFEIDQKNNEKPESSGINKFKYLNAKMDAIHYSASENIPELANAIQQSPVQNKKK